MANKDLTIGIGALGTVFLGKLNKKGDMWLGDKKDITNEFLGCVIQKFGPSNVTEIRDGGKLTHHIIVVEPGKQVLVDGEEVVAEDAE